MLHAIARGLWTFPSYEFMLMKRLLDWISRAEEPVLEDGFVSSGQGRVAETVTRQQEW